MSKNEFLEVIELRNYLLKPNMREKFSYYFAEHFVESQNSRGGYVLGQFSLQDNPNNFFWVRGFENIKSRSRFLPEFYYGDVWKKFGGEANEMMLDSDDVYLLKPVNNEQFFRKHKVMTVDLYFAADGKLDELIIAFQTDFVRNLKKSTSADITLWRSELSENDFPRLPVFQYENLLAVICGFENKADHQSNLDKFALQVKESKSLITKKESLIAYEI